MDSNCNIAEDAHERNGGLNDEKLFHETKSSENISTLKILNNKIRLIYHSSYDH